MSLVIPIFVRGVEKVGGFMEFPEVGGGVVKKRESPDFRSPEVGISALPLKNSTTFKAYPEEFYRSSSWGKELGVGGRGCSMLNAKSKIQVTQSSVYRRS